MFETTNSIPQHTMATREDIHNGTATTPSTESAGGGTCDTTTSTSINPPSNPSPEWWYFCDSCSRKVPRHEPRYNCQACQDFDYCGKCIADAPLIHPGHTFATIAAPEPPPLPAEGAAPNAPETTGVSEPYPWARCQSCAPVTQGLPLSQFILDPERQQQQQQEQPADDETPPRQLISAVGFKWPLRISSLVEATQRGCAFCAWMLHTFFRATNFETLLYEAQSPWYARPLEHDKERMSLVEHCMGTLTRLKDDRFRFDVYPTCSRMGSSSAKPWDFDRIRFVFSEANLEVHDMKDLKEARVFHSAGVIAAERYVYAAKGDPASKHITTRPPNPSPASEEGFSQIRAWLQECETHHGSACRPASPGPLPSRLIDVSHGDHLRLYLPTRDHEPIIRYTALSYVWGTDPQPFQTTIASLTPRLSESGFPLSSLPQTLQDAVRVTQALGIAYLWVDALCIVQDDTADKYAELGKMSAIYQGAFVTLVAARARGVGEGFLHPRDGSTSKSKDEKKMKMKSDGGGGDDDDDGGGGNGEAGLLWKALVPLDYPLADPSARDLKEARRLPRAETGTLYLLEEEVNMGGAWKDPVAERAWCLQERVLSPRLLSYGRWPTWRCNRMVASDGGYYSEEGKVGGEGEKAVRRLTQAMVANSGLDNGGAGSVWMDHFRTAQLLQTWRSLVQDYTQRKLTVSSDRLPAIGGIARELSRLTGMEYLAGLWKENMLQDLMWYARTQEWRTRPAPAEGLPPAPTWSWAAVEAPILCDAVTADATPLAKVLACSVQAIEGKSTFDVVGGGTVSIHGPFAELKKEDVVGLLKSQNKFPAPPSSNVVHEWYRMLLQEMWTRPKEQVSVDDLDEALPERVFGLLLFERDWTHDMRDEARPKVMETCYFGLLLRQTECGKYERIGAFWNDTSEWLDQTENSWGERSVVLV
ncbi:heterokaryon incompatibility protein-domain-containing protein [Chaetomium strumarium]|uniref:Heterokaryon incompatibility protein-domain-containing protein n=1 Tax=Chaetomium strumarium TaxID=1170767 RepID=A0AAJ0LZS1_9PEZI|nr:heterokaryon incompatibility protein-domain-containing protein [Chaetomium strumarium]